MRLGSFLLLTAVLFAIVAVVAAIAGGISWAIPVVLVAIIVVVFAVANRAVGERSVERHGGDDETALGDTPELHAEISPHDIPKGAPERQAAEDMAPEESSGTAPTRDG